MQKLKPYKNSTKPEKAKEVEKDLQNKHEKLCGILKNGLFQQSSRWC